MTSEKNVAKCVLWNIETNSPKLKEKKFLIRYEEQTTRYEDDKSLTEIIFVTGTIGQGGKIHVYAY